MKTLADGTVVCARVYYYLLDWNEQDGWKSMNREFGVAQLCLLTIEQYAKLFEIATKSDLENLNKTK